MFMSAPNAPMTRLFQIVSLAIRRGDATQRTDSSDKLDIHDPWARYLPALSTVAATDDNPLQSSRGLIDEEGDMSLFPIDAATSATSATSETEDHWAAYQRIRDGK